MLSANHIPNKLQNAPRHFKTIGSKDEWAALETDNLWLQ